MFTQERHRIDVDCRRTDRTQPLFSSSTADAKDEEKRQSQRYSTISPHMSDIGAQSPSNEHIERMGSILLTYNFYEKELGMYIGIDSNRPWLRRNKRVCSRNVRSLCPCLCCYGCRWRINILVFCQIHGPHGKGSLVIRNAVITKRKPETELSTRSKRHEEAVTNTSATHRSHGPGAIQTSR